MTGDEKKDELVDWVQQRGTEPGRRHTDRNQCAMHDYMKNANDHCFDIIKKTIKDEVTARDHKFELLESKLEGFISKWAFGMIVGICLSLAGTFVGTALWQISSVDKKMSAIAESILEMTKSVTIMSHNQDWMLQEIEKIGPEHIEVMRHVRDAEKHIKKFE